MTDISYSITFSKDYRDNHKTKKFQDRITDNIWFTRLSKAGPLFNYKYYLSNSIAVNKTVLYHDLLYINSNCFGGTIGVKWGLLSDLNLIDAPGLNPALFSVLGVPESFYSFSQLCTLLTTMINNSNKPLMPVDLLHNNAWNLENNDHSDNINMTYLENKDLACYIDETNEYFKIKITHWGNEYGDPGSITYVRTPLFTVAKPVINEITIENTDAIIHKEQKEVVIQNEEINNKPKNQKFKQIVNLVRAAVIISNEPKRKKETKVNISRNTLQSNWKTLITMPRKK